ncbi:ChaN family lipoprotein [Geomonas sp. RF6]|uniref:ChaN family lipoprotein n=1 Tax=Geomonas sp. RF6 TaxID=2897342 RepID=UPI001E60B7CB|nr:ChaN family lipoprotein [Geomonas sp. RF6]UFS70430.1 ChaN family lipoprotein [Geomonas sp. RF6]
MSNTTKVLLLVLALLCSAGCSSVTKVMRLEDRESVSLEVMMEEVRNAPLILVGEHHDVSAHHKLQLEIVKRLHEQGKPVAIGLEMFEASTQGALDAWVAGKVPVSAFIKVYQWNWRNLPWGLYEDIFIYARDNHIPMVGLNAPRNIVQQVSVRGFDSLTDAEIKSLPPGVTGEVSDAYLKFIGASYPSHGRKGDAFRRICEAQMLRNRYMAQGISRYLARHPERTMVVLAGAGHARHKGGIPMELGTTSYRVIIPAIPGLGAKNMTPEDADYLMLESFPLFDWLI